MNDLTFIILGGGIGKRFGGDIPKQFLLLKNKPIIFHSIIRAKKFLNPKQIIVVLAKDWIDYWNKITEKYELRIELDVVIGGEERFFSVKNALKFVKNTKIVAVHDGVRPNISFELLNKLFKNALKKGNAIPYVKVNDTIFNIKDNEYKERKNFICLQTPQFFETLTLIKAYDTEYNKSFTDDSSVVKKFGVKLNFVKGDKKNIKITDKEDLKILEKIFE